MKTKVEKRAEELDKSKKPIVSVDSSLNKYHGKVLFPKKLTLAEEQLKGVKLPGLKNNS